MTGRKFHSVLTRKRRYSNGNGTWYNAPSDLKGQKSIPFYMYEIGKEIAYNMQYLFFLENVLLGLYM